MAVDFVLAPEAEQDVREAYDWYESCRNGLGEEFLGCVDAAIERICRTPDFCAKVHAEFRRATGFSGMEAAANGLLEASRNVVWPKG